MAKTTIEKAQICTPDGNITIQLSGEDGHITLCVTSKKDKKFFDNVVLVRNVKPSANKAATDVSVCKLSQLDMKTQE
jgi:hypothetical protein